MERKHIVCFGDSNTYGYCAENHGRYDEDVRWTCLLQKMLGQKYLVIEEGLEGRTCCMDDPVTGYLAGIDLVIPCLRTHKPVDLLIVMLGTNDTKERFGLTPKLIARGLDRLVLMAKSDPDCYRNEKPNILIISPQRISKEYEKTEIFSEMGSGCSEKSEKLAEYFRIVAKERNCRFLNADEAITTDTNHFDYMHLTVEGHRQLASALQRIIAE